MRDSSEKQQTVYQANACFVRVIAIDSALDFDMRIVIHPWYLTAIAVLSVGFLFPLFHWLSVAVGQNALNNPIIWWRSVLNALAVVGGIALLLRMPWSRFCYLIIALMTTGQFLFWFPFRTLFYAAIGSPGARAVFHRVLALTWEIVPFLLSWIITIFVFRYFSMKRNLTSSSTVDAPRSSAPIS